MNLPYVTQSAEDTVGYGIGIDCEVYSVTAKIKKYMLYHNDTLLAESDNGRIEYTLTVNDTDEGFYVITVAEDGRRAKTDLLLTVNKGTQNEDQEIQFGSSDPLSIKIPDDVPFLGGGELSLADLNVPVFVTVSSDGTVRLGINIEKDLIDFTEDESGESLTDEKESRLKEFLKEWDEALNNAGDGVDNLNYIKDMMKNYGEKKGVVGDPKAGIVFNCAGYGETKLDPKGGMPEYIAVNVMLEVKVKAEFGWQIMVVVVPVVVELGLEGGVSATGEVKYSFKENEWSGYLDLEPFIKITIFAGVGVKDVAGIGITGSAEFRAKLRLLPAEQAGLRQATLTGAVGIKAYLLFLEYEKNFAEATWTLYDAEDEGTRYTNNEASGCGDIYDISAYDFLEDEYPAVLGSSGDTVISGAYPAAQPSAVKIGDDILMTFLATSAGRSKTNKTVLMYTYYDSESGTWSQPKQADGNNTLDGAHRLYTVGGKVYLVYTESDTVLSDSAALDDFASHMGVTVAVYDSESGTFTGFERISADGKYCSMFDLSYLNTSSPIISWVQSSDPDVFGQHSENEIVSSTLQNGAWSAPKVLRAGLNAITSVAAAGNSVYYIYDSDNKLRTTNDRVLMSTDDDAVISEGTLSGLTVSEYYNGSTTKAPYWYDNGSVCVRYWGSKIALAEIPGSLFTMSDCNIYFVSKDSSGRPAVYEKKMTGTNTYSSPYKITDDTANIQYFDISGGALFYETGTVDASGTAADRADIKLVSTDSGYNDLQLVSVKTDPEDIFPGNTADVKLDVFNDSPDKLTKIYVYYRTDGGDLVYGTSVDCSIARGESASLTAKLVIPETLPDASLTVTVSSTAEESGTENSAPINGLYDEAVKVMRGEMDNSIRMVDDYAEVIIPIATADKVVNGIMIATVSMHDIEDTNEYLNEQAKILILLFAIIALFEAFIISRVSVADLVKLNRQISSLNEGHLENLSDTSRFKEYVDLTDSFNVLLDKMQVLEDSRQEFVSNVSHELKTPITSMKVLADSLLMQEEVPNEMYREFMSDMVEEIDRESKIINDLLTLVKMDKKSSALNIAPVNINALIELLLKRIKPIAAKRNIEVVFESFREVVGEIDEVKLTLAFSNLIENAVKYNNDGGSVYVSLNADHKFFYVKVQDTGVGIPEDCQSQVFERFYRVDKARSRDTGGTGLGLAIKLFSEPGDGTTFTVRIPLKYVS